MTTRDTLEVCRTECTSGCHADDCDHHGHLPDAYAELPEHAVIVLRIPHTAEPCSGQCHRAVQAAVGRAADADAVPVGYPEFSEWALAHWGLTPEALRSHLIELEKQGAERLVPTNQEDSKP